MGVGEKIKAEGGFTLVEIMISISLAIVLTGAVYMIFNRSMISYRVEDQFMSMQDRLRFGMDHLKRDISRVGFLATPNSVTDEATCPKPSVELRALRLIPANGWVYQPFAGANDNVQPASLLMFGDFFSGQVYRSSGISGDKVFLQGTANFPGSQQAFEAIFTDTRYLRIITKEGFEMYYPIVDFDYTQRMVQVSQSIPTMAGGSMCGISGFGDGLEVNVAGFDRYRIAQDERPGAAVDKSDLIRELIDVDGLTVVDNSRLVIMDFAVDLQFYDLGFDQDATGSAPDIHWEPLITGVTGSGSWLLDGSGNAIPEDLRFLTVKLTVRSEEEDPYFAYGDRETPWDPLDSFELSTMDGSCRCFSMATRIPMTSLLAKNLKEASGP